MPFPFLRRERPSVKSVRGIDRIVADALASRAPTNPTLPQGVFFPYGNDATKLETLMGFSEAHLRFIAESLPQIVWTALPTGKIDYMNARWFEYTGFTEEETYRELKTAVHPDDYLRYKTAWANAVAEQRPYEIEYRFRRASDGMYRWHLGRGLPLQNAEGVTVKWFGTCIDIQVQKEAEQQLRDLNEHLETIVLERTAHLRKEIAERQKTEREHREHLQLLQRMINTLPMAAVATDREGKILHTNEQFHALCVPPHETFDLIGRPCVQALAGAAMSHPAEDWQGLLDSLSKPPFPPLRQEIALSDGRTFLVESIPSAPDSLDAGALLLVRDISPQKRVDTAKSEFMSLASHQLRTPLTAIRWSLGRLRKKLTGKLEEEEERLLTQASSSLVMMSQTIHTMLSISRAEAGLNTVTPSSFSLCDFLQTLVNNFSVTISRKQLSTSVDCEGDLHVVTDPVILREILENLISNAVKYTPSGGTVRVRASREAHDVRIEVIDSGYGIPQHQQEKVFSKFFRAENILKIDTEGTGLGLYLVSRLVDALKATIDFSSKPGKGTTFTLRIPS